MGFLAEKCIFAPLTEDILLQATDFSCGNDDLDDFFYKDSIAYRESLFGKTYCFYLEDDSSQVVCAFTVSNASIFTNRLPNARKKKLGKQVAYEKQDLIYPAVLIGRFGIDVRYQHQHIGSELMQFIKVWFIEPSNKTGCRYLQVDAYNTPAPLTFYKNNGFDFIFSTEEQEKDYRNIQSDSPLKTRLMFFDLMRIAR